MRCADVATACVVVVVVVVVWVPRSPRGVSGLQRHGTILRCGTHMVTRAGVLGSVRSRMSGDTRHHLNLTLT